MKIGGLLKFSIIDFPGKLAAVVFTQGCNLRCPYCHNAELVLPEKYQPPIPLRTIFDFLKKRQGQLNGVVISGGEPTVHQDLKPFLQKVKDLDYAIKLDTNGTHPEVISDIIHSGLVDYISMDIKAPLSKYHQVTGIPHQEELIKHSIRLLLERHVPYEFRSTVPKDLLKENDIQEMSALIKGATQYHLQRFVPRLSVIDPVYADEQMDNYSEADMQHLRKKYDITDSSIEEPRKN
ncbi:MAG: anaerobic ribonucleoside-triphosphate reductase activating protein [Candidatus Omnitrophica bacterium]|nr:anaerobic ribonucleoside-triphosphate reductase activating protein [Candidatus Omnitrophota bacterium]